MNERRSALPLLAVLTVALAVLAGACSTILGVDFDAPHLAALGDQTADGGGGGGGEGGGGPPGSCIAKTCAAQGFACGTQSDGCGGAIECGACGGGSPCVDGKCACAAKTCPEVGASCGAADNGCGGALDCGTCSVAGEACVQNKCQCQPKNCTVRGATCGTVPDGCGNTYDCGSCANNAAGPNCGGGGPNKCGANPCVPLTCTGRCGDVSDGCGAILKCPGCAAPQTCGGAGAANVCGCTPTTCPKQGKNCGPIGDGCGGTLDCGPCSGSNSCGGAGTPNVCGCTPSATTCPPGQNCGSVPNGCGTNIACGAACITPQSCGGGGVTNVCGCTPLTCDDFVCGQHPNGCGGNLFCGSCACFTGGTRITMADGSQKPIESVVAGDWVRTADPATGIFGKQQVVERTAHPSELSRAGIVVVDGLLHATRNHPITANGKTVAMEQLQAGDVVTTSDGAGGTIATRIRNVTLLPGGVPTFDLVLADRSNHYFADGVMIQQKAIP